MSHKHIRMRGRRSSLRHTDADVKDVDWGPITFGLFLVAFIVVAFIVAGLLGTSSSTETQEVSDKIVVRYGEFNHGPLELVVDSNERASLRVRSVFSLGPNTTALNFLRDEVLRLVSSEGKAKLGDTGLTLEFVGRCPIWAPYSSSEGWKYLHFADGVEVVEGGFRMYGRDNQPTYKPYPSICP